MSLPVENGCAGHVRNLKRSVDLIEGLDEIDTLEVEGKVREMERRIERVEQLRWKNLITLAELSVDFDLLALKRKKEIRRIQNDGAIPAEVTAPQVVNNPVEFLAERISHIEQQDNAYLESVSEEFAEFESKARKELEDTLFRVGEQRAFLDAYKK